MSGAKRIDLHVHSIHSPDGRAPVEEICRQLGAAGLSGFALTDHNTVAGHARLLEWGRAHPGYLLVPGVEISTREGHLLAYGISEAPPRGRPVEETIDWVRARGGEPVLAHPFRRRHGVGRRWAETARIGALEIRNGHNGEVANARAELVASQRQLAGTGGSDAHALADLGTAHTVVSDAVTTVDELLGALRRRRVSADGSSLSRWGQLKIGSRSFALLVRRGFRTI